MTLCTALILIAPLGATIMEWSMAPGTRGDGPTSTDAGTYWNELATPYQEGSATLSWSYEGTKDLTLEDGAFTCGAGQTGYLLSLPLEIANGKIWDFAWADFGLDDGEVRLEVRDPDTGAYPASQLIASVVADSSDDILTVDLNDIDVEAHGRLQLAIVLDHSGGVGTPPTLLSWRLGQQDVDMWHDPFMGVGRDTDTGDLSVRDGTAMPLSTHLPGGLWGDYYDSLAFANFELTRLDQTIDFNWGNGAPSGGMGGNRFSIRWEGKIMVPAPDTYTFYLFLDDGGRMWIDGVQLIDEWHTQTTEHSGQITLEEGLHDVRIEYYENTGGAQCKFRWSSSSISKEIVPHTALWGRNATNVLVSEDITLPEGNRWDYLKVEKYSRGDPVYIDIIDARTSQPVSGLVNLLMEELDLSIISPGTYSKIRLRARFPEGDPARSSVLLDWGIKWLPERTWRAEFLTDLKVTGMVGIIKEDGEVFKEGKAGTTDVVAFAESFDGTTHEVFSNMYMDGYNVASIPTTNATDVEVADLDEDGIADVIFTNGVPNLNTTAFRGTPGGFSNAPTWTFAHSPNARADSVFKAVMVEDLEGDGDLDIILLETNGTPGNPDDQLIVYLKDGDGWNSTPDMVITLKDAAATVVDAGDINGDGWVDFVLGLGSGSGALGAFLLWGGEDGYGEDDWKRLSLIEVGTPISVHVGNLDDDGYDDIAFGGHPMIADHVNIYLGKAGGLGNDPDHVLDSTANAITYADWNGDGTRDVVLVKDDEVSIQLAPFSSGLNATLDIKGGVDVVTIVSASDAYDDLAIAATGDSGHGVDAGYVVEKYAITYTRNVHEADRPVAVSSGEMFGPGSGSIRSSVIDLGIPTEVGNWNTLSYRMSRDSPHSGQSVEFRLVDIETGEVLWRGTATDAEGSLTISPPVSAREHSRVYLDAYLNNENDWLRMYLSHMEINWTERFHVPPNVLSIETADDVIYRTNSTTLMISVGDELDPPDALEVNVQMQTPGGGGWLSVRLSTPEWDGEVWTVTFSTTRDDPVGDYSFRARAIDTDMVASDYLEVVGLVTVLNNPPGIPSIAISPEAPGSADDLTCEIVRQAFDRDTSHLDYNYTWYRVGGPVTVNGSTVRSNDTAKGQVWRVTVQAFDGLDLGGIVETSVTIRNTPPVLIAPLEPVHMYEDDETYTIRLAEHFADPDGDELLYEIVGSTELEMDLENRRLTITPMPDWHGRSEVQLNVSDGEAWFLVDLVVDVESIPDQPIVVSVGGVGPVDGRFHLEATQDERSTYLVVVTDVDSTKFRFHSDGEFGSFQVIVGNGTIEYMPTNGEVGDQTFNLSVADETGSSIAVPVDIYVANVNDPPGVVTIIQPKPNMVFEHDATILLQGSCVDPDEQHGQALFFAWSSDIDGELGSGTSKQVSELTPGTHKITLQVSDAEFERESSVRITVNKAQDDPNGGGGGGGGGDDDPFDPVTGGGSLLWILLAIILIILVSILVLYRTKLRKIAPSREEHTKQTEDGGINMVEGIPMTMLGEDSTDVEQTGTGTDMRSLMLGSSRASTVPEETIPSSPWSEEELRTPVARHTQALAFGSKTPSPGKASAEAAGWVEAPETPEAPLSPRVQQKPPPPPPPPAGQPPLRQPAPKKPTDLEAEWEEA